MKVLSLILFSFLCFISYDLSAQTLKQIENDLLRSFKRIDYWDQQRSKDTSMAWSDSLEKANDVFGKKLKDYTQKYPATITYLFSLLVKEHLNIISSTDGLFRIYTWDTWTGGTMHFFENVMQFKSGENTISTLVPRGVEGDGGPYYDKLYTFKANSKTYYLTTWLAIGSTRDYVRGIQTFSIENGKLNTAAKIIKTRTGLHSEINYEYDLVRTDEKTNSTIHFDLKTQSIYVPIVLGQGKLTNNYIIYKFTGQYFERVKN
jgi:hypothetical protein